MVQFSKNVKKAVKIDEVSDPLYFLKDQTSHYINICISFSKKMYCLFVNYPYIYTVYIYIYIYMHTCMLFLIV